ncbi:MAG: ABC transporter substrate-binding protein [Pseudomonadota bacterium]
MTDDLDREVEVPTDPQRIAVLHDKNLGTPLIELGVLPVGSHGRVTAGGEPFIRGSITVTGLDFDNSAIEFLGGNPADLERIAAVQPDLIITSTWQDADVTQLSQIAPTVVVDTTMRGTIGVFPLLAEATSREAELAVLEQRYEAQIAQIRRIVDTENITVSVLQGVSDGCTCSTPTPRSARSCAMRGSAIPEGSFETWSAERLPDLDADVIFMTYRTDQEQVPQDARDAVDALVPGFCELLHACRAGKMVILPRAEAISASYDALMAMAMAVLAAMSSNEILPMEEG